MPISAMVIFTTVVFLVAVTNIDKVTQAKLKVQNLADAVALNIASQIASSMNKTADLNEWMNHLIAQGPNVQPTKPGDIPNCATANPDLPPISCAENRTKSKTLNLFSLKGPAASYAGLIQKINMAQQMFIDAYNNFIGAGVGSNSSISNKTSLTSILLSDIPELGDPGTSVFVWNYQGGMIKPQTALAGQMPLAGPSTHLLNTSGMQPLKFKVRDITVTYKTVIPILHTPGPLVSKTLGQLLTAGKGPVPAVGWMEPDVNQPMINVGSGPTAKTRVGAGALVIRKVQVPILGSFTITGQAQAYVVDGSGTTGAASEMKFDPAAGVQRPVFKPTYWVKLAGVQ